jgi:hypothetical protein
MSVPKVDEVTIAGDFQRFCDACFAQLPDEGKPADPYLYSSHAGAFVRALDQAKDHWVKAKLSFYGGSVSSLLNKRWRGFLCFSLRPFSWHSCGCGGGTQWS